MLSSITPLGERGRNNRWRTTAGFYLGGSVLGGLTFGLALGAVGQWLVGFDRLWSGVTTALFVAAILLLALLFDAGVLGERVPSIHRQVNEDWLDLYRSWVYGTGFGWQLGFGVVTIVPTAGTYVAWLMAMLTGSWWMGAAVGGAFGLARGLPLLLIGSATDPARLRTFHRRMAAAAPLAHRSMILVTAVALISTLAVVAGGT